MITPSYHLISLTSHSDYPLVVHSHTESRFYIHYFYHICRELCVLDDPVIFKAVILQIH